MNFPSGNETYWKITIMGKSTISMVIFFVATCDKLPESTKSYAFNRKKWLHPGIPTATWSGVVVLGNRPISGRAWP